MDATTPLTALPANDTTARLRSYLDRLERLLDQLDDAKEAIKELKTEIKNDGFNVKALDRVVALRRNKSVADKETALINDVLLYAQVTGTPLDVAAPELDPEPGDSPF